MGALFKIVVLALAVVGACFLMTSYRPTMWTTGYDIPGIKVHVSWAATALAALLSIGFLKLKYAK